MRNPEEGTEEAPQRGISNIITIDCFIVNIDISKLNILINYILDNKIYFVGNKFEFFEKIQEHNKKNKRMNDILEFRKNLKGEIDA